MECESIAESVSFEDGVVQIAFDLAGSPAGYLILSRPHGVGAKDEFFGTDHYVEVRDQLYAGYGAIEMLEIDNPSRFRIRLRIPVPDVGRNLTIVSRSPMPDTLINELQTIAGR